MQYFKTTTTLLCFCFAIVPVFSQTDSLVFQPVNNPLLQQYNIRHINTGSDGKLWLSTDNGLLCYDGNDVKIFKHEDGVAFTLSSNNVLKTYTDSKGNLFVLESPQIIDYLDVKTGRANQIDLLWKGEDLRIMGLTDYPELFIDDESIWIAKYYVGFSEYNIRTMKTNTYYYHDEYSGKNTVYTIKKDEHNKNLFWLGTDNGIYSFNKSTKKIERNFHCSNRSDSSIADLKINHLDVMNGDTIWFTVPAKGFGCYAIKTGLYTMYPFMNENEKGAMEGIDIFEIKRKSQNEYLIGTENNLPEIFNTVTHQYNFKVFTSQNLPAVLLNHFIVDSAGNFWCTLYNRLYVAHSTLDKFSTVVLYNYSKQNKKVNFFKNIVWDSSRKLYYAAFEKSNGIFVLDSNLHFLKIIPIDNRANKNIQSSIYDLGIDKQNRLWVCGNAVYIYDSSSQKLVTSNKIYPKLLFKEQQFQNLQFRGNYMFLQPSNQKCRAIYRVNLLHMDYDSIPLPKEMINDNANGNYQPVRRLDYLVMDKEGKNTYWGYFRKSFFGYIDGIIQYNIETLKANRISHGSEIDPPNSNHLFSYALDDSNRLWVSNDNNFTIYEAENSTLINRINIGETAANFSGPMCNAEGKNLMCKLSPDGILLYDYKSNKKYKLTLNDGLISYSNSGIAVANNFLFTGTSNYIQYIPLASVTGKANPNRKCFLSSVQLFNQPYQTDTLPQYLHNINLPYNKNFISLTFSSTEFQQTERLEYRYKLDGADKNWFYVNALNRTISYNNLPPGNYTFQANIKNDSGSWSNDGVNISINIIPALWQTTWFKVLAFVVAAAAIYWFVLWRIKAIKKQEKLKGTYEKELLELDAKALRAQMNPHFIFNCMNSIKSLIQKDEREKAVTYLTAFSKLIRTVFQNSDKREISLFDEIETCRLYTQLESMRFVNKFNYIFKIDEVLDLKSIKVPALILQPFIENAIWHGIMPKEDGGTVTVIVNRTDHQIQCIIDDDGIGRDVSKQNKFLIESSAHESKGERLTQARLDLDNLLNERNASIQITDKKDENNKLCGTNIILRFNEY